MPFYVGHWLMLVVLKERRGFSAKVFECAKINRWQRCSAANFKAVYDN